MMKQLRETRLAVNELIQKRNEDSQYFGMQTLLRIAQRANQTTREQVEHVKLEVTSQLQAQDGRVHTMEVGFAELNEWAEK